MLIDWFTVVAQALNFLILVWLMKRFLYQPILRAIDAREQRIAGELEAAAASNAAARAERDAYQHKNAAFDEQHATRLREVIEQTQAERQRLLESARQEAAAARAERDAALSNDALKLNETLKRSVHEEVFAIARRVLGDLSTTSLETRIVATFARRLETLDGTARAALIAALGSASGPVIVLSAFDLPGAERSVLQRSLNETFAAAVTIEFRTAPDLISGIELIANGHKIAWSIADYLGALEDSVADVLGGRTKPAAGPGTQS